MFYKQRWFRALAVFALLIGIVIWIWKANQTIDGSRGGILKGPSHKNGGIDGVLRSTGEKIELEGTESIINKNTMAMQETLTCQGTPSGIASALNVAGGGVKFDDRGNCRRI